MENKQSYETKNTNVLSDEERRSFDGLTIDEEGREQSEEDIRRAKQAETKGAYEYGRDKNSYDGFPKMKVYTFSSLGWKGKLVLATLAAVALGVLFFFGSLFLIGFSVVAVGVALLALLRKLF
ncbi:hypothetical protein [Veillonella criceti]|uniref:Uncharacterized protein n=1 Tax=Veillonella criceti TaxID=103891 RepID=A0A380NK19_9FIRM|nr:hypothetical protein [Veillonella criceti]SUP41382.1 Uncharacterised protein [Veillonella criceti]